ncbi:MAG: lytic transglycosylase domain-containing protein, partial [Haloechinothrix sp.]
VLARLGVVVAVLGVAGAGIWGLTRAATLEVSPTTLDIPALSVKPAKVEPGSIVPVSAALKGAPEPEKRKQQQTRSAEDLLADWANRVSLVAGIPARALMAYGKAELVTRESNPGCSLSWATLAGIGRVESYHGQYGGAVLLANGRPSIPIIGVPLDGSPGVRAISDTDGGRFDGDTRVDRAVGPMQFIPSTWARYAADGNGDGKGDPQQIDDAALAAARYLCVGQRDMASAQGWWAGILSYNRSVEYAQKVFGQADAYAKAAQTVRNQN